MRPLKQNDKTRPKMLKRENLQHAYNDWWVVTDGKLTRRANESEVKRWMVVQLLEDLPTI